MLTAFYHHYDDYWSYHGVYDDHDAHYDEDNDNDVGNDEDNDDLLARRCIACWTWSSPEEGSGST